MKFYWANVFKVAKLMMVLIMFLVFITTKPLEVAARPFDGRKLTAAHGGGGGGGGGSGGISNSALVHKEPEAPPGPSPCTFIPQKGDRHCH
ncbi:hypothetical protein ACSBR2_032093 [Camellia fascicularis]